MAVEIAHASQSHYGDAAAIGLADAPVGGARSGAGEFGTLTNKDILS